MPELVTVIEVVVAPVDHINLLPPAPMAVSTEESPWQKTVSPLMDTDGDLFTKTVACPQSPGLVMQPPSPLA